MDTDTPITSPTPLSQVPEATDEATAADASPPPASWLRADDGRTLQVIGEAEDQLALAARLSEAGLRLVDPETSNRSVETKCGRERETQSDTLGTMLATPEGTPPAVFHHAVVNLGGEHPPHHDLLHPVARAGWSGLPDTRRFVVTGYSGHGNMLLQAVLRAIDDEQFGPDDQRPRPAWVVRLRVEADHHSHVLRCGCVALFESLANRRGTKLRDYVVSPGQLADATARARFNDGHTLVVGGLPYAGFVGNDFGAHTIWSSRAVRFFPRYGYGRVYCIVRDPLAGLASNAAKTVRPLERVLHDPAWFARAAAESARYLAAADAHREHFRLIRFEDLLRQPVETIRTLAEHTDGSGGGLSEAQAEAIWSRVGFKPVTAAGAEHLVDPMADKRVHFRRAHLDLIRDAGLDAWFEPFGYRLPDAADLPDGDLDPAHANAAGVEPSKPSTLYGRVDPITATRLALPKLHAEVRATDPVLAEQAAAAMAGPSWLRVRRTLGDAFTEGVPCMPDLVS